MTSKRPRTKRTRALKKGGSLNEDARGTFEAFGRDWIAMLSAFKFFTATNIMSGMRRMTSELRYSCEGFEFGMCPPKGIPGSRGPRESEKALFAFLNISQNILFKPSYPIY
jgi:hypothetical protein